VPSGPKTAQQSAGVVEGANNNHPAAVSWETTRKSREATVRGKP
jgi:hypothetical protein